MVMRLAMTIPHCPQKYWKKNKEYKEKLKLKAALFEGNIVGSDKVENLAKLPSRTELIGKIAMMLNSPMTKLAMTLNGAMASLVNALKALETKKNN